MRSALSSFRARRWLLALAALSMLACAGNPTEDAGTGMDGSVMGRDGSTPTGGRCGATNAACCTGRVCELGLSCGSGDICCVAAGGGARCERSADCCRGLSCEGNACCAPRSAACTGSGDCCTGLVCSGGACLNPDTDLPGEAGCGGAGGVCCTGFVCRSGLVCNEGMCEGCGMDGMPCCDGASPCLGSLGCEVMTGLCRNIDPATACGRIDNACCPDPVSGSPTDCEGGLVCVGGTCLRPTDTGFMGAPCGPRGTCDTGLACDRRMVPSGICNMVPSDCGMDGMMCCDLGGSEEVCAGELHCQFGECSTCRGPSLTCLLGGLLPGQECCSGSVCRPAPLIPRCCMGDGGMCENSLDCCGFMSCSGGSCSCSRENSFCLDSSECCDGLTCQRFQCRTAPEMCNEGGSMCMTASECCAGLACSPTRTEPMAPPVNQCCSGGSTACDDDGDCCGRMRCQDGECECITEDGLCDRDIECCGDGYICAAGSCVDGQGCARETENCDPTMLGACCGRLNCRRQEAMGPTVCCAGQTNRCRADSDCCGDMTCGEDETCQCRMPGESCVNLTDCCTGLCEMGTCSTA
ncbi:MAG: hypothetical protein AB7S26_15370 [Sandaracinaceae bacterium]